MPSERSDLPAPEEPASTGDANDARNDPRRLAAEATAGDPAREAAFWRARAEELAARLARLERRMHALSERLPSRWVPLLACDPEDLPELAHWPDPLAGWHETIELESARVASVLPRLWERLDPDASR